ncbi:MULTISPECIES: hypothetical protein [unclassified Bradyrhizobium]|uniref:hypothetical protein n=1 Tax=unclassified Bradyrhizobium TaxID=2631580 RepID=UPI0028E9C38F|nr:MULTISPECIES: hypothetical protein [unclassified Bradyrhizobium]
MKVLAHLYEHRLDIVKAQLAAPVIPQGVHLQDGDLPTLRRIGLSEIGSHGLDEGSGNGRGKLDQRSHPSRLAFTRKSSGISGTASSSTLLHRGQGSPAAPQWQALLVLPQGRSG